MNNNFFRMNPFILNKETYKVLTMHDEPPTLYSLMNSYVNFNKEESELVKIIDLPNAFKDYLFDFSYPLDDEFKASFEENFLSHYMFRRIGYDTYMSFKIHLKNKLNEIMSKYNAMFDEFSNLDFLGVNETHTRTISGSSSSQSSGTSGTTSDNRYSDTPENQLTDVQNGTYLTDYTYNSQTGSSSASASGTSSSTETITIHRGDSTDEYLKYQNKVNRFWISYRKK